MFRLLTLIPTLWSLISSGSFVGMRGKSVPSIHVYIKEKGLGGMMLSALAAARTNKMLRAGQTFAFTCLTLLALLLPCASTAATLPDTDIDNVATATFNGTSTVNSNLVRVTTVVKRTPSTITFLQYAPADPNAKTINIKTTSFSSTGDLTNPLPSPQVLPYDGAYQLPAAIPVIPAQIFHGGHPLLISLEDHDQNLQPDVDETIWVRITSRNENGSIDEELLLLTEDSTTPGVFYGYVQTSLSGNNDIDGVLTVEPDGNLTARYRDSEDGQDTSIDAALVDPYGILFDSLTGEPVDGASVTLWDVTANREATVFDDFGQPYPSTVTSGDTNMGFPPGGFRFPLIQPGRNYRLDVVPLGGYQAPSAEQPEALRVRFPNLFVIDDVASYGGNFLVNPGPAVNIDIPLDPSGGSLWLIKEAMNSTVAVGDFLQYSLTLENTDEARAATGVVVNDRLPLGFRYQAGSLHVRSNKISNPQISTDGRTLMIDIGTLAPSESIPISYVAEITSGAKTGEATNTAVGYDGGGNPSNKAQATVVVKDEFFNNKTFILGRVLKGSCAEDNTEKEGLSNARIYLEDGSYIVTDEHGRYHFEGISPGVHVVQLDLDTVPAQYEVLPCEENSQFAGRAFSQFVDLQGGTLWRANFYVSEKPPVQGNVQIELSGQLKGDMASFSIPVSIGGVALQDLRLSVILPEGITYQSGSSTLDEAEAADPEIRGPVHTYRLGGSQNEWQSTVRLSTTVDGAKTGEFPVKAVLTYNTPEQKNQRTPMAETLLLVKADEVKTPTTIVEVRPNFPTFVSELSEEDKVFFDQLAEQLQKFKIDRLYAIGHTDNVRIAPRSRHIHADNRALSEARAKSVARYLGGALQLPPNVIVTKGMAETEPVAKFTTEVGRALNRRVEIRLEGHDIESSAIVDMVKAHSGPQSAATSGKVFEQSPASLQVDIEESPRMPDYDSSWLTKAQPELKWLWPANNHVPSIPNINVAIQHTSDQSIKLKINGQDVSPLAYNGRKSNQSNTVEVSTWKGIGINDGDNTVEAIVTDKAGTTIQRLARNIHYSTAPATAEFVQDGSILVADGKTIPYIRVTLKDKDGYPIPEGIVGDFSVLPPYRQLNTDNNDPNIGPSRKAKYKVGPGGVANIKLDPSPQAGEVTIIVPLDKGSAEIRTWLKPAPRDWILVGFAEGTVGYSTFSGNQVSLEEAGIDENFYDDGEIKFFAKGAIKGDWLLTMAYDSNKPDLDGDSLHQTIDPDTYYPLYGDGTKEGYEAASARNIYLKIERDQFYALFGDMDTGLTQTELSRYSRNMNGIKSEMQGESFSYTVFAADTKQSFAKDEIRGDGTSGRYYLSTSNLVTNSEQVVVEVRDRFHSERILDERTLTRHRDYDIDYDNGSLFFKEPIPSKDENFNPVYISVRYETKDSKEENLNYGGRAAIKLLDKKVEIGASHVHEERGTGRGDLYGVDTTVTLAEQTALRVEAATTDTKFYNNKIEANAYLGELKYTAKRVASTAYYREQQEGFGLGQQNGSETGTRKYGIEGSYKITERTSATGLAYHEDVLSTGAERDVAEVTGQYQVESYSLRSGLREVRDRIAGNKEQRSTQGLVGADWLTLGRKLKLRADYEQSLANKNQSTDFPTLLTLGADYQLAKNVSVFSEQQFSWGEKQDSEGTRVGFKTTPWQGGNITTTMDRQFNENGERINAIFGLGQSWQVNERWGVDFSIDRSHTIKEPGYYHLNNNVPEAHGSDDDFTSLSAGSTYRKEKWTWWNRLETRQADNEEKYGASTSIVTEPQDGVAFSAKALAFITKVSNGTRKTDGNVRLGMAYRPTASRWIMLNRLDFYFENEDHSSNEYDNWRIVNNMHANFHLNRRAQMSFYYGLKYVRDTYNGITYSGFTDLIAIEARYNINKRWDIGAHATMLHSWNSSNLDYSIGADVGYSPMTNTWISLGYNIMGFEDEDFSTASYTAEGVYMRFRAKFDQQSVRDAAEWINK